MKKLFPAVLVITVAFASTVSGQSIDPTSPEIVEITREGHINSHTTPDGITFIENARLLDAFAKNNFERTVKNLADDAAISQDDAEKVVKFSMSVLKTNESDVQDEHRRIACFENGQQRFYGDETYAVMEQMDDVREVIAEKHLANLVSELGEVPGDLFKQWLHDRKPHTVYIKFDFKKAYERSDANADGVLAGICDSLKR